jgi:hypothetical protein
MADQISNTINSIGGVSVNFVLWAAIIIAVLVVLTLIIGGFVWYYWSRKRYNLKVEIKMPRSDGKIILGEWGRGLFNAKRGVLLIKRNKMRPVPSKVVDIRKYLQGVDLITVIQVAPEDYRPVLNDSWTEFITEYEDDKTHEIIQVKESILNIKVDSGLNKAWKSAWDAASKRAFSLQSFLNQFQTPIAIAVVVVAVFVGIAILWTKVGSVCGK